MAYPTISTPNNINININTNDKTNVKLAKLNIDESELIPRLPNDIALECLLKVPITSHPKLKLVSHLWKTTLSHPSFFALRRHSSTADRLVFLTQPLSPATKPKQLAQTSKDDDGQQQKSDLPIIYHINVYNAATREWRTLKNIDVVPTFSQCVSVPHSAKVVLLGGWDPATLDPSPRVVVIDLAAGVWREGAPMPTARSFFAAAAVDGGVYVVGGHDARKNALRTAEVYDVEADEWRKLPEMAEERDECHGIVLKDENNSVKFWVVSGYGTESQGRFRSDGEYYNPETNTWVKIENIWPYAGDSPKYTVVTGDSRWMSVINGDVKEFDFEEKAWKTVNMGRIPKSVSGSSSISMVDVGGGRMMVMGNGERCGDGGCDGGGECKEEGCGGEGVYMVEEKIREEGDKKGEIDWNWEHVHAPNNFLGFPFSSSHLLI